MFRKLISNLPFNPSLINQVSFYAKRMHQETAIRRMGAAFVALAMVLQIFSVISPPQPTLARVGNDLIPGGAVGSSDKEKQGSLVNHCNANDYDFATILGYFGVSCTDLFFGSVGTINSADYGGQLYSMGRAPYGIAGETPVNIPGAGTFYMRLLNGWGNANYRAIIGTRANGSPFMVLFDCGNIVIVGPPPVEKPQKSISCANLIINVPDGSKVPIGSEIGIRGQATGQNLDPVEYADMYYEFSKVDAGVLGNQEARGVQFKNGVAEDTDIRKFNVNQAGHYQFKLAVKYDSSTKDASGNGVGACVRDVYVDTPPPTPEKVIECSALIADNFTSGQKIVVGTSLSLRGLASGRNILEGEKVDMLYDYVDSSGKVVDSQRATDIPFKDTQAEDKVPHTFKIDNAGTYTFRLQVKYDSGSKEAGGSRTGDCVKQIIVELPCAEDKKGKDDTQCLILSKTASNDTRHIKDANGTVAQPGDTIIYTLTTKNTSKNTTVKNYVIRENLIDIMQYADILNLSGGTKDKYGVVTWPAIDIQPEQSIEKKIIVRIKNPIPNTPVSVSDPGSYDMKLTNIYGNKIDIKLPPSIVKTTEYASKNLPNTGPGESLAVGFMILSVVGYFFMRSRLLAKEADMIRHEYAASGGA